MGGARRSGEVGHLTTGPIVRVIPDVPSFSVDSGFRYKLPPDLEVVFGSQVRVPLGGRQVRGYVVDITDGNQAGLREIRALAGDLPIFTHASFEALKWVSAHYLSPLSAVIRKASPPNLPRLESDNTNPPTKANAAVGERLGARHLIAPDLGDLAGMASDVLRSDRSVVFIAPTATELDELDTAFGSVPRVVVRPNASDRKTTTAWIQASIRPQVVLGTARLALWPFYRLGLSVVVDEGRRGHKDRQTPTLHTRDVMRTRSRLERFESVTTGMVPSSEIVASGVRIARSGVRAWSRIELVDRREDPPGSGIVAERVRGAVAGALKRKERVLIFSHLKGYAPAFRCVSCRALRKCVECGARPEPSEKCVRCGASLGPCQECGGGRFEPMGAGAGRLMDVFGRWFGKEMVGRVEDDRPLVVGTARDLPALGLVDLAIVTDADGLLLGSNYRAAEEGLRLMARVARRVPVGRGKRTMVQTSQPDHPALVALRRGESDPFYEDELAMRSRFGFPPIGELMVVEVEGASPNLTQQLKAASGGPTVHGPAEVGPRQRWLIHGSNLDAAKRDLRGIVQKLRDGGAKVRIDVDPIDL